MGCCNPVLRPVVRKGGAVLVVSDAGGRNVLVEKLLEAVMAGDLMLLAALLVRRTQPRRRPCTK
jgi:hypothetical protein